MYASDALTLTLTAPPLIVRLSVVVVPLCVQVVLKDPPPMVGMTPPSTRLGADAEVNRLPFAVPAVIPVKETVVEDLVPVPRDSESKSTWDISTE